MKRTILSVLAVSAALLFTACGESEPRLDTSSESAFAESMEIMLKKLSPEEQNKLKRAIHTISLKNSNLLNLNTGKRKMMELVNGKTAQEVIAHAE